MSTSVCFVKKNQPHLPVLGRRGIKIEGGKGDFMGDGHFLYLIFCFGWWLHQCIQFLKLNILNISVLFI